MGEEALNFVQAPNNHDEASTDIDIAIEMQRAVAIATQLSSKALYTAV
jgi:hypothetical protein